MAMTRREALERIAKGSLPVIAAGCVSTAMPAKAMAFEPEPGKFPEDAVGLLYDTTRCVGCKSCVVACSKANDLAPDTSRDGLHQAPGDLNWKTKNIIKLYKSADGSEHSYFKKQCMQCADPACVAACMFHGLTKDEKTGIITWNGSKCVGCRYCEDCEVRALPAPHGEGPAAWLLFCVPDQGRDLRQAFGLAEGSQGSRCRQPGQVFRQ